MSVAETRSQLALWSMMSAPLILSSDVDALSAEAIAILGNKAVLAVDQDRLGKMATLVQRNESIDVLFKRLSGGDDAIAVLNHGPAAVQVDLHPADFGFAKNAACQLDAQDLWTGAHTSSLKADVASHDTVIWRVHPSSSCGTPTRTGTITLTANEKHHSIEGYTRCLAASGKAEECAGTAGEAWTATDQGTLKSAGQCLAIVNGKPAMQPCTASKSHRWHYTLLGNLTDASGQCLTASEPDSPSQGLSMQPCGHNQPNQIWSLPN